MNAGDVLFLCTAIGVVAFAIGVYIGGSMGMQRGIEIGIAKSKGQS